MRVVSVGPFGLILVSALSTLTRLASAQHVDVSVVTVAADHVLLSENLVGCAARVGLPRSSDRVAVFLGYEQLKGSSRRTGPTCGGFGPPSDPCNQPEALRDDARLQTASAGIAVRPLASSPVTIDIAAGIRIGRVMVNTQGQSSGRTLPAKKALIGGDVGVDVAWVPFEKIPVTVSIGAAIGYLGKASPVAVEDGYEPFGGFGLRRLRAGLAWWPSPKR